MTAAGIRSTESAQQLSLYLSHALPKTAKTHVDQIFRQLVALGSRDGFFDYQALNPSAPIDLDAPVYFSPSF